MKPTNEALRAWAAKQVEGLKIQMLPKRSDKSEWFEISVPQWGTVQVTERRAFVEAVIEIPLKEDGSIAD